MSDQRMTPRRQASGDQAGHETGGQDKAVQPEPVTPTQLPPLLAGRRPQQTGRRGPQARRLAGNLHAASEPSEPARAAGPNEHTAGDGTTSPDQTRGAAHMGAGLKSAKTNTVPAPRRAAGHLSLDTHDTDQDPVVRPAARREPANPSLVDAASDGLHDDEQQLAQPGVDSAWLAMARGTRGPSRKHKKGWKGLSRSGAEAAASSEVFNLHTYPDGSQALIDNLPVPYSVVREIRDALGDRLVVDRDLLPIEQATPAIDEQIRLWHQRWLNRGEAPLADSAFRLLRKAIQDAIYKLGRLQPLLELPGLTDIIIRGPKRPVRLHFASGPVLNYPPMAETNEELIEDIKSWIAKSDRETPFDPAHSDAQVTLPDGSRMSASGWFSAWPTVSIRLHPLVDVDLDDCVELGMIDDGMCHLLRASIRAGKTIIVSGMMKAGKTVLIRAILNELHPSVPIATVETEFELMLHDMIDHPHYEVWPTQELPGGEGGTGQVRVMDIIPKGLRQTVDVVVVGEVRSREVIAMLEAMQAGQSSVSTIHAPSARETIERIVSCATSWSDASETWAYRAATESVDLIVHIAVDDERWIGGDRLRYVDEIWAPKSSQDSGSHVAGDYLYKAGPDGRGVPTGDVPSWIGDISDMFDDAHYLTNRQSRWPKPLPSRRSQSRQEGA